MKKTKNNTFAYIGILVLLIGFLYYFIHKGISYYVTAKNPKDNKTNTVSCITEANFVEKELAKSTEWSLTNRKPADGQTLTDLPIYVPFQGSDILVGYKGNIIGTYTLHELTRVIDYKKVDAFINKSLVPTFTKAGYSINRISSDSENGINSLLTIQKNSRLINLHIYEADKAVYYADITCTENTDSQTNMFKTIATHPAFNSAKNTSIEIWDYKDNVYVLNVFPKGSLAGHVIYTTTINNTWENLYEGQETPNCEIFENKKIGKGLECYDQNTKERRQVDYK